MKQDQALGQEGNISPAQDQDEISITLWPDVEVCLQTDDAENGKKSSKVENSSDIWSLFTKIDDNHAECNLCQIKLSCEHSIADLTMHKEDHHYGVLMKCSSFDYEPSRTGLKDGKDSLAPQVAEASGSNGEPVLKNSNTRRAVKKQLSDLLPRPFPINRRKYSETWQYFNLLDTNRAECKICLSTVSYRKGGISNMKRHIIRHHPNELVAKDNDGQKEDDEENADNSADDLSLEPQNQSIISDVEEESEEETSEDISKNTCNARSSDQASELCCPKRIRMDSPLHEEDPTMEDVSTPENLQSSQEQNSVSRFNIETRRHYSRVPRSSVWKVFMKLTNGCFECKICGVIMSKKSRLSNLLRHVKRVHPSLNDLNNSAVQKKIEEFNKFKETNGLKRESEQMHGDTGQFVPVIHTFSRNTVSTSTEETVCSTSDNIGCLFSERLVKAVEEGNQLLRGLQSAVERQGEALNRLAACLVGMQQVEKEDV